MPRWHLTEDRFAGASQSAPTSRPVRDATALRGYGMLLEAHSATMEEEASHAGLRAESHIVRARRDQRGAGCADR